MNKINKFLLVSTLALVFLVGGALAQTIYRNRQVEALRKEIKNLVSDPTNPSDPIAVIQFFEERIKYAYEHKPLLNLDIGLTSSFAEQRLKLCPELYKIMTSNTVVLDFLENTNLQIQDKQRTTDQVKEIQQAARSLFLISGCIF